MVDLDPFTVYGFFNKGIADTNRQRIITEIKKGFGIEADILDVFLSIPILRQA